MIDPRVDGTTPVIVQGITGRQGRLHSRLMREYGTNIVGGVSPNAAGGEIDGLPVFATCAAAVEATGAAACVTMVRPDRAADAIIEAAEAGLRLIACVSEGIPVRDAMRALNKVRDAGAVWIGASSPGMAVPGQAKLGFLPDVALRPGPIGVMSKSGTLSYEVGYRLVGRGIGQSVWVGVGGDPVKGTRFAELVPFYHKDAETEALLVVGEIGGNEEEELAEALIAWKFTKPVYALIAGSSAPEGVTMGHAGALVHGSHGSVASKRAALEAAGARVYRRIRDLVEDIARDSRQGFGAA